VNRRERVRVGTFVGALALLAIGVLNTSDARADTMPRCANDEPVTRCVWDAKHQGNGIGRSFRGNRNLELKYLSHERAHELAGF